MVGREAGVKGKEGMVERSSMSDEVILPLGSTEMVVSTEALSGYSGH